MQTANVNCSSLGIQEFNKTGITSVHNMNGDMEEMMAYAALEDVRRDEHAGVCAISCQT